MMRPLRHFIFAALAMGALSACSSAQPGPDPDPGFGIPDREPNTRAPLTASCDAMDPVRCMLPWPSSTFTKVDTSTNTGIRVHIDSEKLIAPDDVTSINLAD